MMLLNGWTRPVIRRNAVTSTVMVELNPESMSEFSGSQKGVTESLKDVRDVEGNFFLDGDVSCPGVSVTSGKFLVGLQDTMRVFYQLRNSLI